MPLGAVLGGIGTAMGLARVSYAASGTKIYHHTFAQGLRSPLFQGGGFGVGYTAGAYGGYGATNTWDPFGLHKPKYKHYQQNIRLPYGSYGRRYGGYTRRYSRFRRYRGYRRRSYRNYYRRSYY
jgi:hypothetical protein